MSELEEMWGIPIHQFSDGNLKPGVGKKTCSLQRSKLAQIRVQVSGKATLAIGSRKETGAISLALNCFIGKMEIRMSVCPLYPKSVNRDQIRSPEGKQSGNF